MTKFLIVLLPGRKNFIQRGSGNGMLETANMKGEAAETWMGFLSIDEKDAACSVYMGSVML